MTPQQHLEKVLAAIREEGPTSDFAQDAFVAMLELLPAAPKIPSRVFLPLTSKTVATFLDYVLVRNGKVYMTYRKDASYVGWHFPGFMRTPGLTELEDCQQKAPGELGDIEIQSIEQIHHFDHALDHNRTHHGTVFCHIAEWKGEPNKGKWFDKMPPDILPIQVKSWPYVEKILRR